MVKKCAQHNLTSASIACSLFCCSAQSGDTMIHRLPLCGREMHHPPLCNAASGSNTIPCVPPFGSRSTSVVPTVNTPSDIAVSYEQPFELSQLTHRILSLANVCFDNGSPVLLHQFWRWFFLLQQYALDPAVEDLS